MGGDIGLSVCEPDIPFDWLATHGWGGQDPKFNGKQVFKHKWTLFNFTGYESSQSHSIIF